MSGATDREDAELRKREAEQRSEKIQELLDEGGAFDCSPCPDGPYVHHPGERCLGCGRIG